MIIKNILSSYEGIIKSTLKNKSVSSYPFIATFSEEINNYGPTFLIENVKWTNWEEKEITDKIYDISEYETQSLITFIKIQYDEEDDFLKKLVIGTPIKVLITSNYINNPIEPNNYNAIYIGNNIFVYNGIINILNPKLQILRIITYDKYSSVFLLHHYWHSIIDPNIGSFYQRIIPELPAFITSLHVIHGVRFIGYGINTNETDIDFVLRFSLQHNDSLNDFKLYVIYKENFEIMPNVKLNFNTNPDLDFRYYQIASGIFNTNNTEAKVNRIIIYTNEDFENVFYYPLNTNISFTILKEEENNNFITKSFDSHNLIKFNTYIQKGSRLFLPQIENYKVSNETSNDNLIIYDINHEKELQETTEIVNNPNFDLKFINDTSINNKNLIVLNFGKFDESEIREIIKNDGLFSIRIEEILHYNRVSRNTNMILVRVEPDIYIKKLDNIIASDTVVLSTDIGGKIIGCVGKYDEKIVPVPYRIDFNNIGNRILIFRESLENISEIYIIYDRNSLNKEMELKLDNDYSFNEIFCLPQKFVIFITNYLNENLKYLVPDYTPYNFEEIIRNIPHGYSYYLGIIDGINPNPVLKHYNIRDEYKIFFFFI